MQNFSHNFSVIMAVYNVEEYLHETIQSLLEQTLNFRENVQLILVNDGSTDNSGHICDEYASRYPQNILVIHKANGGVASARNEGLRHATGRFLNFMDSDDKFSPDVLEKVLAFWKQHEDETDIVTIPLRFFDARKGSHWQNQKFKAGNRVIDLWQEYASPLMFVNASFFRSDCKKDICFDAKLVCGEDIKVLLHILSRRMRMGLVSDTCYLYRRRSGENESLIQSSKKKFGWYTDYFTFLVDWARDTFTKKYGFVPLHVQYTLCCDLQWRFKEDYMAEMTSILTNQGISHYKEILRHSLAWIDDSIIMQQRMIWQEHKVFMLRQKHGLPTRYDILEKDCDAALYVANTQICRASQGMTCFEFLSFQEDGISLEGYTKFVDLPRETSVDIDIFLEDRAGNEYLCIPCQTLSRDEMDTYSLDTLIFRAVGFRCHIPFCALQNWSILRLRSSFAGITVIKKEIRFGSLFPLSLKYGCSYYSKLGWTVKSNDGGLLISKNNCLSGLSNEIIFCRELWKKKLPGSRKAIAVRIAAHIMKRLKRKPILLLSDRINKADDNGEALFTYIRNNHPEDTKTYFILDQSSPDFKRMTAMRGILPYLSIRHKLLMLICDFVVSSQMDEYVLNPFKKSRIYYQDLLCGFQYVFLQHGVTKDDLSRWLNRYRMNIKGFVTSGSAEYASILNGQYYYSEREIWLTGMPRYDRLTDNRQHKILIMPTWRAWLMGRYHQDIGVREAGEKLYTSKYIAFYDQLLNDNRLLSSLRKYGYTLSLALHPYISQFYDREKDAVRSAESLFHHNDLLTFEPLSRPYHELFSAGDLLVTDYSSVAFDFAYLRKPVIYAQFDFDTFFSGEHTVLPGYFSYEKDGFGEVEYNLDDTVGRIIEYIENQCRLKNVYRARIDRFFSFEDHKNCERVYRKIMEESRIL